MKIHHHHYITEHHPDVPGRYPLGFDVRITTGDCYICGAASPAYRARNEPACPINLDDCIASAQAIQKQMHAEARTGEGGP